MLKPDPLRHMIRRYLEMADDPEHELERDTLIELAGKYQLFLLRKELGMDITATLLPKKRSI